MVCIERTCAGCEVSAHFVLIFLIPKLKGNIEQFLQNKSILKFTSEYKTAIFAYMYFFLIVVESETTS